MPLSPRLEVASSSFNIEFEFSEAGPGRVER